MSNTYVCSVCENPVDLETPRCRCPLEIPDLRMPEDANSPHSLIYQQIGFDDLSESFQPFNEKNDRAKTDLRNLKPFLKHKNLKILEIGPGDGLLTQLLMDEHDVYVMDITTEYIKNLMNSAGTFLADIETMPFNAEFDVVIFCDVLEHVLNEGDALLAVRRALRDDGIIYVRCPANEPLITYSRRLGSPYPYVHLRTYSTKTIKSAALHAGFKVLKCRYMRTTPAGFARRSFGLSILKTNRSMRHTLDVYQAHNNLGSTAPLGLFDWLATKIEALMWLSGWKLSRKLTNALVQRIRYRPSEVFVIAKKRSLNLPST